MKQHITIQQLKELTEKQCDRLLPWLVKKGYQRELSIGQMIEFIINNERKECDIFIERIIKWRFEGDHGIIWGSERGTLEYDELCDALWEAVKVVLNET